ncbi:MAG: hypothetical protein EAX95_06735 [Candidatus Thorarchaeota archaeon]|nr:hypothetical protein [Candidatus Thorarchaeota archaeon]
MRCEFRYLVMIMFVFLFISPVFQAAGPDNAWNSFGSINPDQSRILSDGTSATTGSGSPIPYTMTGIAINRDDGTFLIDADTAEIGSITLSDGWSGSNLQATIDELVVRVDDALRNPTWDGTHPEKWLIGETASRVEDVIVPDDWTLVFNDPDDSAHPHDGVWEMVDRSGQGYSGSPGFEFQAEIDASYNLDPTDEMYLGQHVLAPWRSITNARITFYYYVKSTSDLSDQVHLFTRFAGVTTKYHVFESTDATDTWIQATTTISPSQLAGITLPNALQFDIGLATDISGTLGVAQDAYVLVDEITLEMNVRPFPEQIGLKVNGTSVIGATPGSVYPYEPDDDSRDAWDDSSAGLNLNGNTWIGTSVPSVGTYSSTTSWTDTAISETGIQFQLNIPYGAAITAAYLEVEPSSTSYNPDMRIHVAGFDSTGQPIQPFTAGLPHLEDRLTYVGTSIDWDPGSWMSSVRIRQRSPDIAPLIQSVVSETNWASGNYISVILDYMWSTNPSARNSIKGAYGTTYAANELPRLFVEYLLPLPEDTVYLMQYQKDITIDHTKVSATLTDFPVMIDIIDNDLKTKVQADGDDIAFRLGDNALDFEIELFDQDYSPTQAHLVAWIKIPTLSSTADTVITMLYGNPDAGSTSSSRVWTDYAAVHHMADDPSGTVYDSTSNNHDGTAYGGMDSNDVVTGIAGNALDFTFDSGTTANSDMISIGQVYTDDWTDFTVSIWVNQDISRDCRVFSKTPTTTTTDHRITTRLAFSVFNVRLRTDGTATGISQNTNKSVVTGNWHYLVWSWSATRGSILAYMDGQPALEYTYGGTSVYDSNDVFVIANNNMANDPTYERFFDGQLDEIRLTTVIRDEDWIDTEYENIVNHATFYSVGSEEALQTIYSDADSAKLFFSTTSISPVTLNAGMTMEISGSGQSLDESMSEGTSFVVANASVVEWTANILVSPPADTDSLDVVVQFPQAEWKPVYVFNPLNQSKVMGTDWWYEGSLLIIDAAAVDYWGVWELRFASWNYIEDLQLGKFGETLSSTGEFNITDTLSFRSFSPTITGATTGFSMIDPSGSVWYSTSSTTAATDPHLFPSFRYRKTLTVPHSLIQTDVVNYPFGFSYVFTDLQNPAKVQSDGSDILFEQNGIIVPHEIEIFTQSTGRLVAWVRLNLSSSSDTPFTMYYGNPVIGPLENPHALWSDTYEAVWHLSEPTTDESTGAIHYDSTAGGHDGTQYGNMMLSGKIANAQFFDGTSGIVDDHILIESTLAPEGDVMITGWFNLGLTGFSSASATSLVLMEKFLNNDVNMHLCLVGGDYNYSAPADGSLVFKIESASGARYTWTTKTVWNPSTWYYFACYMDSSNQANNKIYINEGSTITDVTDPGGSNTVTGDLSFAADWAIGGGQIDTYCIGSGEGWFAGYLDEIRVLTAPRSVSWLQTEYSNQYNPSLILAGSESSRLTDQTTVSKALDSTAGAGEWIIHAYYNDTGTSVANKTGLYERNFIVKHDSSLSILAPGDATSDQTTYKVTGDMLYVEVELTDDVNSNFISGATVTMDWSVSGTPTTRTFEDYGDGRYGIALNTTDLGDNQQWQLDLESIHPYYNKATNSLFVDLHHDTDLSYIHLDTTPVGFTFTATLIFEDAYSGAPVEGATITFSNGTAVNVLSEGGGMYNISLTSDGLGVGDHSYSLVASKAGAYLVDGSVDVTFTLRPHYTTVSVSGDLITPHGFGTQFIVTVIDTDTGGTLSISSIDSFSFTWSGGSQLVDPVSSLTVDLLTATWPVGTRAVTLTATLSDSLYYNPETYDFDIVIRNHYTAIAVQGDLVTPWGFDTQVTVVVVDLDTGLGLDVTNVDSYGFTWSGGSYDVDPALSLTADLPASGWPVGSRSVTIALTMTGDYDDPSNYQFAVQIRNHYTSVAVGGDFITPWGMTTSVTVVVFDVDTGTELTATEVSSYLFTWTGGSHNVLPASSLTTTLPTDSWPVGLRAVTLAVTMAGDYNNPASFVFNVQIRNHYTSASVIGDLITPWGMGTFVTVVVIDLDTGAQLTAAAVASYDFTWTGGSHSVNPALSLSTTIPTDSFSVGTKQIVLTVAMSGDYANPAAYGFNVQIRNHFTSITVIGNLITPHGEDIGATIVVRDTDTDGQLVIGDVDSFSFSWSGGSYGQDPATSLSVTLPTNSWTIGSVLVNLSLVMSGDYDNPSAHQFTIQIRKHYTAVTVVGSLTSPYGNITPLTVRITDLDTGTLVAIGDVDDFDFTWVGGSHYEAATTFDIDLPTDTWSVGTKSVTLTATMDSASIYNDPSSYVFLVTIRSLATYLFNEPSDLIFPTGFDFNIILGFNVTEPGIHYGETINGEAAAFVVRNASYIYPATVVGLGNGRYNLTIDASFFLEGTYMIIVSVDPVSNLYASTQLVIVFNVRPARSDLTANLYTVSTPYNMDAEVTLYYIDLDRSSGITTATITSSDATIDYVHSGNGAYVVTIDVSGFSLGSHTVNLTADATGYDARSVIITIVVTQIHTNAEPSVISLDMPVGSTKIFYISYDDLDNGIPISGASYDQNWTGAIALSIQWDVNRYKITFTTTGSDTLGIFVIWFNFTKGANYQPGYCEIEVDIRSHVTIFNLVSAVEPTTFTGTIEIPVRYYDWDNRVGIDSAFVQQYVYNSSAPYNFIPSVLVNDGGGYYTIQIDASLCNLGLQSFLVYFNWTGPVAQYENKVITVTANIIGIDSKLTLIVSSEPTPYGGMMSYEILYAELAGQGITNTSNPYGDGNVHIYVIFTGESVDLSQVTILEIDYLAKAGRYLIEFNSSLFARTGLVYMTLFINWTDGVAPFYTNRVDTISVRILPRDTIVSVIPASATPYNENATFSFTFEDVTGTEAVLIGDSPSLGIVLSLADYTLTYDSGSKWFTISFDTVQFGSLGQQSFTLDVTWTGVPYYQNRTGQLVFVTVTFRQTTLDYQSPPPTSFGDSATFTVTWTDIASLPPAGILGATVTLYDGLTLIPGMYYTVTPLGGGQYRIVFDSDYYSSPGTYSLSANVTSPQFYYDSELTSRQFALRYRTTLLSSEPIDRVPYNSSMVAILHYQDILTLANIGNDTFKVTFIILTTGDWIYTCEWKPGLGYYVLTVETYNQVGLEIGIDYSLWLNISYADENPYYRWDDLTITFQLRYRESTLERTVAPVPTPYLDYANFTVYFSDADAEAGIGGAEILVSHGGSDLNLGTEYLYTALGGGFYDVSVRSDIFGALGSSSVTVWANWILGEPYHDNASLIVAISVITRSTNIEIDVPPARTSYLENVTFIVSFIDLGSGQLLSISKNMISISAGGSPLQPSEFAIIQIGAGPQYEISINSVYLSSGLVSNLIVTIAVDWPNAPDYYAYDSSTTRVTIIGRSTFVSINRPGNTAFGENATFTFQFLDTTTFPEQVIADSIHLTITSSLIEFPTIFYNSGTGFFEVSFNTAQFGSIGLKSFYLNLTWAGSPYYLNKTIQVVYVTVTLRQTQVNFEAPDPTPYGDLANFTLTYLDIAGTIADGISEVDATLKLYYLGVQIPGAYYSVVPDGTGNYSVSLDSGYFTTPGIYAITAEFTYTGTGYKADASAVRNLNVRVRATLLSVEPVGQIGYGTVIDGILVFQDQGTLSVVGNLTNHVTFTILTDFGVPWVYTIEWQESTQNYHLLLETDGQPFALYGSYSVQVRMSYAYVDPFYGSDTAYILFSIRTRTSSLDIQEAPLATQYLEYSTFTLYYWDADVIAGIPGATILLENTTGVLTQGLHYFVTAGVPGVYYISLNTTALDGLGLFKVRARAIWPGGQPFHDNAARNVTVSVVRRQAEVELVSPPSIARYLDNVTFTLAFIDSLSRQPIIITAWDITLYAGGLLLSSSDFTMTQVGTNFEVSINSTVLGATLVTNLNVTIVIDWQDTLAPYNMTIPILLRDEGNDNPIQGAIILFSCQEVPLTEGFSYWIAEGTGANIGLYTITVWTEALTNVGNYHFDIRVQWDPLISPYYSNRSVFTMTGSVDLIWTSLQADSPLPSSIQITDFVSINVTYRDVDHGQIGVEGATITVVYVHSGLQPQDYQPPQYLGNGTYLLRFSTAGLPSTGSYGVSITVQRTRYTLLTVVSTISVVNIRTSLTPAESTITLDWTDLAWVIVTYDDLLHGTHISGASLSWNYAGAVGVFTPTAVPGQYQAYIDTTAAGDGTKVVTIYASKASYDTAVATVTLVVLPRPSEIEPIDPAGDFADVNRGSDLRIEIRLVDSYTNYTISWTYDTQVYATFSDSPTRYYLSYNSTSETWWGFINGTATGGKEPGIYTARITAIIDNYNPGTYQFKVDVQLTKTTLRLEPYVEELVAYYTQNLTFTIRFTYRNASIDENITLALVRWTLEALGINETFTHLGNGLYSLTINTSDVGLSYGIWRLTFRGLPDDPYFSEAFVEIKITINKIPTEAVAPDPLTVTWGWAGNISFYYNNTFGLAGIEGATVTYDYGGESGLHAVDIGGGWYLIEVNTTLLESEQRYTLRVYFLLESYENAETAIPILVYERETAVTVITPEQNQVDENPLNLVVPMGDLVEIILFYNDTDPIASMFGGGIVGATILDITKLTGPSFSLSRVIAVEDLGGGYYRIIFDTSDLALYNFTSGVPRVYGEAYRLAIGLDFAYRESWSDVIRIRIINRPTVIVVIEAAPDELTNGFDVVVDLYFGDTWSGTAVEGAEMIYTSGNTVLIEESWTSAGGHYFFRLRAVAASDTSVITIELAKRYHINQTISFSVTARPNEIDNALGMVRNIGLPIALFVIMVLGLYVRVWSVPKRIRQINGQIKALRKGKMPKPIPDVQSRQQILATLFNDTYAKLEITRVADQMPDESIRVAVPEMGELLVQLSILTNLSPDELEEFKADIAKMRMSEQAAFVKEVIMQEAIRAARREGKTVDEILEGLQADAKRRLAGAEKDVFVSERFIEPKPESVVLVEEEPEPEVEERITPKDFEDEVTPDDRLSPFEIEQLRKDLEERGVPPHEIDTILEQAKVLPRELVEELIKSLEGKK